MATIKIYKITSAQTPDVYIGSTKGSLAVRMAGHRRSYSSFLKGERSNMTSFAIVKFQDATIELLQEVPEDVRDDEELRFQQEEPNCINKYDPTLYKATKPALNMDHVFTDEEKEKINGAPTKNAKYVLRNYYRNRQRKCREATLRAVTKTGKVPRDRTLEKYNITAQELAQAIRGRWKKIKKNLRPRPLRTDIKTF